MSPVSIPAHLTSSSGRSNAFAMAASSEALAQADPQLAAEHLDDVLGGQRVGAGEQRPAGSADLRGRARGGLDRLERGGHLGECRAAARLRARVRRAVEHVLDREAQVGVAVVGLAERRPVDAGDLRDGVGDRRPAQAGRALVGLRERPAGEEDGRDRQLLGRQGVEVVGEQRGLLGGPGGRRHALGKLAPAAHGGDGIPCRPMAPRAWFPEVDRRGPEVVLRRHVPENLTAFRRWYADPEIARLARYQEAPMRPDEIERFFAARVVGPDALAMADPRARRPTGSSARARSASSTATTARRCTTSRSARRMPGARATAPRRPS